MLGNDVKFELSATFPSYQIESMRIYSKTNHSWFDYIRYATFDDAEHQKWCFAYILNQVVRSWIYVDIQPTIDNFTLFIKRKFKVYNMPSTEYVDITDDVIIQKMNFTIVSHIPTTLTTPLIFTNSGTGASVSPVAQQLIGETYAKNISNIVNFNKSNLIYPQDNDFWTYFLYAYNTQNLQSISYLKLTKKYGNGMEFYNYQIVLSVNENIQLGEPLTFTLTYGDEK